MGLGHLVFCVICVISLLASLLVGGERVSFRLDDEEGEALSQCAVLRTIPR